MKPIKTFLLLLFVASCAPIYVNYDYEKQHDFTKYKTYNYYSDLETGLSELDTKRLLYVMDEALKAKGFTDAEKSLIESKKELDVKLVSLDQEITAFKSKMA